MSSDAEGSRAQMELVKLLSSNLIGSGGRRDVHFMRPTRASRWAETARTGHFCQSRSYIAGWYAPMARPKGFLFDATTHLFYSQLFWPNITPKKCFLTTPTSFQKIDAHPAGPQEFCNSRHSTSFLPLSLHSLPHHKPHPPLPYLSVSSLPPPLSLLSSAPSSSF